MGRPATDLANEKFGTLVARTRCKGKGKARWECYCDPELGGCGRMHTALAQNLVHNLTRSCGCKKTRKKQPTFTPMITI